MVRLVNGAGRRNPCEKSILIMIHWHASGGPLLECRGPRGRAARHYPQARAGSNWPGIALLVVVGVLWTYAGATGICGKAPERRLPAPAAPDMTIIQKHRRRRRRRIPDRCAVSRAGQRTSTVMRLSGARFC